jgi:hypothetical protein
LKAKINILFYGDSSWTVSLGQIKFDRVKKSWTYVKVLLESIFFFGEAFKYGDGAKF